MSLVEAHRLDHAGWLRAAVLVGQAVQRIIRPTGIVWTDKDARKKIG